MLHELSVINDPDHIGAGQGPTYYDEPKQFNSNQM